ncbi:pentapeptide repeat-containing protein [Vogesella alkaliphila]|uniref:Pentapeptide repeat-containing protein n=1 Tax=Vogesella alkaliphila TaxID=1193621 RepID=A0ABQ2YGF3_9NEIS|nr:hypothetical protein [Vogesella alkaliphila]GGX80837.1 hypothetical protein GCM10011290_05710 [Vogesella alkaliphila]
MNDTVKPELPSIVERFATLPPEVQALFDNTENGMPSDISKPGCLALAKLGKDAWNAWREMFPVTGTFPHFVNHADLSGLDFRGDPVDFSGFVFGDGADFRGAQWGHSADFKGASCGRFANFSGTQWGDFANLHGAQWGDASNFSYARWGASAGFVAAQWGAGARFYGAEWGKGANFQGANWVTSRTIYQDDEHYQSAKAWAEARGLAPDTFLEISFAGAHFAGEVDFSNRKFTGKTDFGCLPADYQRKRVQRDASGQAKFGKNGELILEDDPEPRRHVLFGKAPKFHGCELHQDTTFDGAEFPSASGSDAAARAYRTLKQAFSKQQALREEQRFFRLEMKEEAKRAGSAKFMYLLYEKSSDFGFNLWRPLALFAVAWVAFAFTYGYYGISTHDLTICGSLDASCKVQWSWLEFSLAQSLPLTGFDKLHSIATLKNNNVPVLVLALHKIISLASLFLAGLALRNLFRLK